MKPTLRFRYPDQCDESIYELVIDLGNDRSVILYHSTDDGVCFTYQTFTDDEDVINTNVILGTYINLFDAFHDMLHGGVCQGNEEHPVYVKYVENTQPSSALGITKVCRLLKDTWTALHLIVRL